MIAFNNDLAKKKILQGNQTSADYDRNARFKGGVAVRDNNTRYPDSTIETLRLTLNTRRDHELAGAVGAIKGLKKDDLR